MPAAVPLAQRPVGVGQVLVAVAPLAGLEAQNDHQADSEVEAVQATEHTAEPAQLPVALRVQKGFQRTGLHASHDKLLRQGFFNVNVADHRSLSHGCAGLQDAPEIYIVDIF